MKCLFSAILFNAICVWTIEIVAYTWRHCVLVDH